MNFVIIRKRFLDSGVSEETYRAATGATKENLQREVDGLNAIATALPRRPDQFEETGELFHPKDIFTLVTVQ